MASANPRSFDLLIRGGTVATPNGIAPADVGVVDGRIAAIGSLAGAAAVETFEARGLHVLPGVMDTQVHFREPGNGHKEDLASGSLAAILGGVTTVFEMPNTAPPTTTRAAIEDKLARAKGRMHCDHAFYAGATPQNIADLAELEKLPGVCGVKAFLGSSTGTLLLSKEADILAALKSGKRRVAVHSEDEDRMIARKHFAERGKPETHPVWRDVESARLSTERVLRLAKAAGRRLHVLHVTTGDEIPLLAAARDVATAETTPQHLTLSAPECYERLGAYAQMNPPIRDESHRQALWAAVRDGVIDVIGSDHAPHTRAEKDQTYPDTPSGMPGVQTLATILLDHVSKGNLTLERFIDLTASGPQRIFGIAGKGRIARGYDADFTIVDMGLTREIQNQWIASTCGWTPFDGMKTKGWPVATVLRGRIVMRDFAATGAAQGMPARFVETLVRGIGMILLYLIGSGIIMGLIAAVPIGPVNLICIRRTFAFGPVNGFMSGLGAALGDGVFAAVTGFGLTWIAQLIEGYAPIIELIGGAMLVWFGWHAFFAPPLTKMDEDAPEGAGLVRAMASTFALTVTNPATLLAFTAMFASLGGLAGGAGSYVDAGLVVAGVVGGSTAWWLALTTVIGLFHARIDERAMRGINRASGVLVGFFGLLVLVHLAWKYI